MINLSNTLFLNHTHSAVFLNLLFHKRYTKQNIPVELRRAVSESPGVVRQRPGPQVVSVDGATKGDGRPTQRARVRQPVRRGRERVHHQWVMHQEALDRHALTPWECQSRSVGVTLILMSISHYSRVE